MGKLENTFFNNIQLLPETLTWKSILSSIASQVYFPESSTDGKLIVSRRMMSSSVIVKLLLSLISLPFSSHLTIAVGRDTSISKTIGLPTKLSSFSGVSLGRVIVISGSKSKEVNKNEKESFYWLIIFMLDILILTCNSNQESHWVILSVAYVLPFIIHSC